MIIDIIACLLIALGFYQGFSKGFINTVFATLSIVIAVVAALKLSGIVIGILQNMISWNPAIIFVLGFVLTFILVLWLIRFIGKQLESFAKKVHIGGLDKVLGGLLLSAFYAVLISFGIFFINKIDLISEHQKAKSFTYPVLEKLPEATKPIGEKIRPVFQDFWDKMIETMDAIKEKAE